MKLADLEISSNSRLLYYKKGYTPTLVKEVFDEYKLKGLIVGGFLAEYRVNSFEFLKEYKFLEYLSISGFGSYTFDFFRSLPSLKKLIFNTHTDQIIDLTPLKSIEELTITFDKNKIIGLDSLQNLIKLDISDFKKVGDLKKLSQMKFLEELIIRTASIKSLEGLENLTNLESLILGNCRYLTSIDALSALDSLKKLEFDGCCKIADYSPVSSHKELKELWMNNCGKIDNINFVSPLKELEIFRFTSDSNVLNGDLSPASHISKVSYNHRRHYNMKLTWNWDD